MKWLLSLHAATLLFGFMSPMLCGKYLRRVEWFLQRRARNKAFAILFVFLFALCLRVSLLPVVPEGIPVLHDEFSYLLQADTFALGRLANPTHPLWHHFETFHEIQRPAYASKFFPGQGLFLALGQILMGHPWWGVAFSVACMCALMTWCIQGFLSPGWALFGGLLTAAQFAATSYWATAYWGGAVVAMGGCLALGAAGRLLRRHEYKAGLLFGLGASILALTRPYEGGMACLLLCLWLFFSALRQGPAAVRTLFARSVPAMALATALGLAGLMFYNHAVTGNAFLLPYVAYSNQYEPDIFLTATGNSIAVPDIPREMQRYNAEWSIPAAAMESTFKTKFNGLVRRWDALFSLLDPAFALGFFATVPAFFCIPAIRPLCIILIGGVLATYISAWILPHYLAPELPVATVICLLALRWLRSLRPWGRPLGLALVRLLPVVVIFLVIRDCVRYPDRPRADNYWKAQIREEVQRKLHGVAGNHLVLVAYGPDANIHAEWVYNRADIDRSRVVWARDLGPEKNAALFAYFKDRQRWCASVTAARIDFGLCKDADQETPKP